MLIATDKILHFGGCFLVSLVLELVIPEVAKPSTISVSFTTGLALGKEVGDYMNYGRKMPKLEFIKLSAPDLVADELGVAAGIGVGNLIKYIVLKIGV